MNHPDELLTTEQAAEIVSLSVSSLNQYRCKGEGGPTYLRLGRKIRYRESDLIAWMNSRYEVVAA